MNKGHQALPAESQIWNLLTKIITINELAGLLIQNACEE